MEEILPHILPALLLVVYIYKSTVYCLYIYIYIRKRHRMCEKTPYSYVNM